MLQVGQQHWERRIRRETPLLFGTATLLLFFLFGHAWLADPAQFAERGVCSSGCWRP